MRSLAIDPLPGHILILNGNQQKKREKKYFLSSLLLSLSLSLCHPSPASCFACCLTGCLFVFVLSEKLTRSQNEYENICIGVPSGLRAAPAAAPPAAAVLRVFSDLKIHLLYRRWQFGCKIEHEVITHLAVISREPPTSPDGAEHEWQIEAYTNKWFVK